MLLLKIWKTQPGRFFCISTKARTGEWKDTFFKRDRFKDVAAFIQEHRDKDLYWCPHGFTKPRRLKKYADIPRLLWGDLDESDPREYPEHLVPTIAWESSPGRYAALWVLDGFMTEDLNRRLTYYLKADKGGWDLSQVLRIPDTVNYKYVSTPRVKLLWDDGVTYKVDELSKAIPAERKVKSAGVAQGLYLKYEKKFSGWVRQHLMSRKAPKPGARSQVLWRLVHELTEAGCTRDETFELLRVSVWNKFSTRRDGEEQLRRQIDKALSQHWKVEHDETPGVDDYDDEGEDEEEEYKFLARSMADVEEKNVHWIWYPYLARGEVTILEGDPGLGKSYLAQMVAKGIVDGEELPSPKKRRVTGKVAYFDIENSSGTVTKKRLMNNGCKNLGGFFQEEEPFSIDDEEQVNRVYEAIEHLRPTLVVFDTLNTYIGGADTHKASETQQMFKRFIDIARRFNCSVMVLRHLTKSTKERALYRGQGSIAFSGLARFVLTVGSMPDDPAVKALAVTKINVARPPRALTFRINSLPDTLKDSDRSQFVWGKYTDLTADELLMSLPGKGPDLGPVVAFLETTLGDATNMEYREVIRIAETRSIDPQLLERAAEELGVVRNGSRGTSWSLPE